MSEMNETTAQQQASSGAIEAVAKALSNAGVKAGIPSVPVLAEKAIEAYEIWRRFTYRASTDKNAAIEAAARVIHPSFDEYAPRTQQVWLDEARGVFRLFEERQMDDGLCICGREAQRDPHSCAHELKAEVDGLREELALRDDSLANRRVRELHAEIRRLQTAIGTAHDILDADEDKASTVLLVLKEALA